MDEQARRRCNASSSPSLIPFSSYWYLKVKIMIHSSLCPSPPNSNHHLISIYLLTLPPSSPSFLSLLSCAVPSTGEEPRSMSVHLKQLKFPHRNEQCGKQPWRLPVNPAVACFPLLKKYEKPIISYEVSYAAMVRSVWNSAAVRGLGDCFFWPCRRSWLKVYVVRP